MGLIIPAPWTNSFINDPRQHKGKTNKQLGSRFPQGVSSLFEWEWHHRNLSDPSDDGSFHRNLILLHQTFLLFPIKDMLPLTLAQLRALPLQLYTQREEAQPTSSGFLRIVHFHWRQFPEFVCGSQGTMGVYWTLYPQQVFWWENPK